MYYPRPTNQNLNLFLVPSRVLPEFEASNKTSSTSIPLSWKPIKDPFYIHGILLGYKIGFELTRIAGEHLKEVKNGTEQIVGPKTLTHVLTDLEIYATYRIKIRAFTRIGDGPSIETSAGKVVNIRKPFLIIINRNLLRVFVKTLQDRYRGAVSNVIRPIFSTRNSFYS